jgi:hypothetical protein
MNLSIPARSTNKPIIAIAVVAATLSLAGCYTPGERAAGGAIIGGLGGAAIGAAASGGLAGPALAGAAIGAASGAIIGAATAPPRRCARWRRDYYGDRVCVAFYNY